jgi:hypothetical protein
MRKLIFGLLCLIAFNANAQTILYGKYKYMDSLRFDKYHNNPAGDSVLSVDSLGKLRLLRITPLDTTSLSNRINARVKYSDTASMLIPYLRKIDTTGKWIGVGYLPYLVKYTDTAAFLSAYYNKTVIDSKLALKLNTSDTATMLSPYYRTATATAALALKVNYTDTSTMLSPYQRSYSAMKYTDTASMLNGYKTYYPRNAISGGTGISYNSSTGVITNTSPSSGGTVTNVATNNGSGITGGTITTSGTIAADTSILATRLRVQKGIDSVNANVNLRVKYTDTAAMLSPYTRSAVGGYVPYTGATTNVNLGANNIYANALYTGFSSITASGTQVVLTVNSAPEILVSGSGGQTIKLPDATTLANGTTYSFNNNQTSGAITINNNSNTLVVSIPSGGYANVILLDNSIAAGSWDRHFQAPANVSWSTNTFDYAGSITSATWNGNAIAINRGGTGATTASAALTNLGGLAISDTATMLSGYKTYYPRAALSAGTGITYNASTGVITNSSPSTGGTVTSVATNTGSGITGGTITTSGTIAADTSVLSTKANVTASLLSKVSSVSATSPIASSGGLTPTISISQSSGSTNGYLSSTDWNTFNNKGSGSVTSIATDATMTGGTITTSGTLKVDTSVMATRLRVQKSIDSLGAAKQTALNGTGFVKASGTTISYDNSTYLTGNQTITLSGDVSGSGATAITTTIGSLKVTNGMLAGTINYSKMDATTVPTWNQNTTGTAANITATSNSTITTLTALSLPYSQLTGTPSLSGYVTSVTGTSPIVSSGGTTPAISIPAATSSVNGYLSSTDWTTFNNKQSAISLTTTGTSGVATFSANTLNIPNYGSALSGYLPLNAGVSYPLTGTLVGVATNWSGVMNITTSGYFPSKLITLAGAEPTRYSANIGTAIIGGSSIALSFGTRSNNVDYDNTLQINNGTILANGALTGTSATFSSSVTATTLALGSVSPSTNGIYLNNASANGANYGYIKTNALTVNTTQLILGSTYGYNTPVDALTIFNGTATFSSSVTASNFYASGGYVKIEENNWVTNGESTNISMVTTGTEVARIFTTAENTGGYAGIGFKTLRGGGDGLATRLYIASTGAATFSSLSGTGSRIVVADASGTLSATTAAPTSGTYTPTVTKEVGSMTSISAASATYTRVGNVVTVVATFNGTPISGTNQYNALTMTLPINTNSANGFGNIVAQTIGGIPSACGVVNGYTTSTVYIDINTNYPAPNTQFVISFQYQVTL